MTDEKTTFQKISVKPEVKREIDIIAATEQRYTYEVVDDMLKLYQATKAEQARQPLPHSQPKTKKTNSAQAVPA